MRKFAQYVLALAFAHVLITVGMTILTFGAVMQGFDDGPVAPPRLVAVLIGSVDVLVWPLERVARPTMSGALQYAVLYANGLLWSVVAVCVYVGIRRVRSRRSPRAATVV